MALAVIISVTPWREFTADRSPFVAMFTLAGLAIAAAMINFVVLTSAASSANSGIYSTSRMIYGLAQEGDAPARFRRLTRRRVPARALVFSCSFLLGGVVLLYAGQSIIEAFTMVTTISALLFMFVWTIILVSYLVYRRRRPHLHAASRFKMPGGVAMCWVVLAFFGFLIWALTQEEDTFKALLVMPCWFGALGVASGQPGAAAGPTRCRRGPTRRRQRPTRRRLEDTGIAEYWTNGYIGTYGVSRTTE